MGPVTWPLTAFIVILFFFMIYSLLDGFDLGIGMLLPFVKDTNDADRLAALVAPFWDGNEVWLIMGAGFFFAAFPMAYSLLLSTFYLPFMLTIAAYIFRAASIELSYHGTGSVRFWRKITAASSFLAAFSGLAAFGLLLRGLPFDGPELLSRRPGDYLAVFPFLFAATGAVLLLWHGIAYGLRKSPSPGLSGAARKLWPWVMASAVIIAGGFLIHSPGAEHKILMFSGAILLAAGILAGRLSLGRPGRIYYLSSLSITGVWLAAGALLFPNILPSGTAPDFSLSIEQAAAPLSSLRPITIAVILIIPVILAYTRYVYRVFRQPYLSTKKDSQP